MHDDGISGFKNNHELNGQHRVMPLIYTCRHYNKTIDGN